jgi:aspartokinase-like uncharacterized kinase
MIDTPLRVIKIGGSLLDQFHLADALQMWRRSTRAMQEVFLTGGGPLAESVRNFDKAHPIDPEICHWIAVDAMSLTARMVSAVLPESQVLKVGGYRIEVEQDCKFTILDVGHFLREEEPRRDGTRLPHSWATTSDSISARIAEIYGADELVLLKSALPANCTDWQSAANSGFVDTHFPRAVKTIKRAYCVDIADPLQRQWEPSGIEADSPKM